MWFELADVELDGAELWGGGELDVDGADELGVLLGVVEDGELVVGALEEDVVECDDDAEAL